MKPNQQISLFGIDEPATPPAPDTGAKGTDPGLNHSSAQPKELNGTTAPAITTVMAETTIPTIRKKPGRKEKEKVWKSAATGKRGRKSLKEIAAEADLIEIPADEILYGKQYYSIGEVANMFHMNPSLIRTWTNEFEGMLQPRKNRKGDRYYRPDDVKFLHLVYHLIRVRKFTLEGARDHLKQQKKKTEDQFKLIKSLQEFKAFLLELKVNL